MLSAAATRSAISGKLAIVENAQGLAKSRQEGHYRQNKDSRERKGDMRNVSGALITGVLLTLSVPAARASFVAESTYTGTRRPPGMSFGDAGRLGPRRRLLPHRPDQDRDGQRFRDRPLYRHRPICVRCRGRDIVTLTISSLTADMCGQAVLICRRLGRRRVTASSGS
jgi:hypothetical protein